MNIKTILVSLTLLAGASAEADPPFTPSADEQEISDSKTGLIWRRCPEGMNFSAGTCNGEASHLNHDAAVTLAASESQRTKLPWRLPNAKELATIADKARKNPAIDPVAFPNTPSSWFWSYSPNEGGAGYAWFIDFNDGFVQVNGNRSGSYFVRFVRSQK